MASRSTAFWLDRLAVATLAATASFAGAASAAVPRGPLPPGTYYFSSSAGDDVAGLGTDSSPWRSVSSFRALLAPGVTLLLRRGDRWYDPAFDWDFSRMDGSVLPMRIGAYGDPSLPRPVVARMVRIDAGQWLSAGTPGRYRTSQYGGGTIDNVWRLYLDESPIPKVPGLADLTEDTYCVANGVITVQSARLAGLPFVETIQQVNRGPFVRAGGTSGLTIEDLEIKGGDGWCPVIFEAPTLGVRLANLSVRQFRAYGISFVTVATSPPENKHVGVTVENCTVDKGWTAAMNGEWWHVVGSADTTRNNGAHGMEPGGDGILLAGAVDGAVVRGCSVTNMGHSGIGIGHSDSTGLLFGTQNILVEQCEVTAGASNYCRAVATGGNPRCRNIVIRRNYFHDVNVQSQFGGDSNYIYSNIFENTNDCTVPGKDWASSAISSFVYYSPVRPFLIRNCLFANNTLVNADAFLMMQSAPNDGYMVSNNRFVNNLLIGWRTQRECSGCPREFDAAIVLDSTYAAHWELRHNGFWKSPMDSIVLVVKRDGPRTDDYTAAMMNSRSSSAGNRSASPRFAGGGAAPDGFRLAGDSPFVRAGAPLAQFLPPHLPAVDFHGDPFAPTPSVGAIQYDPYAPGRDPRERDEVALYPGRPNPFHESTAIRFRLKQAGEVTLAVYDLAGRRVATLLNAWRDAGAHFVEFRPQGLAPGVYRVRLRQTNASGTVERTATLPIVRL